jgi:glycosyltransferase involved in cell wall biosynthesis
MSRCIRYFCFALDFRLLGLKASKLWRRKPVVATAPGGPSETVVDGETGLVSPSDAFAIAKALEDLLADPAKRISMGEAGRRRAREVFALPRYVTEFEELYDAVLQETLVTASGFAK